MLRYKQDIIALTSPKLGQGYAATVSNYTRVHIILLPWLHKLASLGGSTMLGSAIWDSPMVTMQAEVTMVGLPVAMVTGLVAMETEVFCIKLPSFDHVTRDPRDRPW